MERGRLSPRRILEAIGAGGKVGSGLRDYRQIYYTLLSAVAPPELRAPSGKKVGKSWKTDSTCTRRAFRACPYTCKHSI